MPGSGASDRSAAVTREDLGAAACALRSVLAAIDAGQLSCSAGYRSRLAGAVVAVEALSETGQADATAESGSAVSSTR